MHVEHVCQSHTWAEAVLLASLVCGLLDAVLLSVCMSVQCGGADAWGLGESRKK
jgi:hypothetical protein